MWRHSYVVSAYYHYATIPDSILTYPVLPCEIFLRVPVKVTVEVLAAGCQLSYRKFYGFLFYSAGSIIDPDQIPRMLRTDMLIAYLCSVAR